MIPRIINNRLFYKSPAHAFFGPLDPLWTVANGPILDEIGPNHKLDRIL